MSTLKSFATWSDFFDAHSQELALARDFVTKERQRCTVYPPPGDVFAAFRLTPLRSVRVVILGQDPYHGEGQAMGLAFSVRSGVAPPPSLANIMRELRTDCGAEMLRDREARYVRQRRLADPHILNVLDGDLTPWAQRGCLLLNDALTVRAGEAGSHSVVRGSNSSDTFFPWRGLTTAAVAATIASATVPPHFILWGNSAKATLERAVGKPLRRKVRLPSGADIFAGDGDSFTATHSAHPSPLSAHRGFFGSRPFSAAAEALRLRGSDFDWTLS